MTDRGQSISVSVVIPAYNAERYIERAVKSVLAQTCPPTDIIVVDDGSTDQTARLLRQYEPKIHVLHQPHSGANEARNRGIQAAGGDWVAFLDADDEWLPENLECHASLHKEYPDLRWSYSDYWVIKQQQNLRQCSHSEKQVRRYLKENAYFDNYLQVYAAAISVSMITLFIQKSILKETGLFLEGQQTNHDPDLALRICYRYPKVGYIPKPLAINHFALPDSITRKSAPLVQERIDFLRRHLALSQEHGAGKDFEPCARMLLIKWLRDMQCERLSDPALELLRSFKDLLPKRFVWEMTSSLKWRWADRAFKMYHKGKRCRCLRRLQSLLGTGKWVFRQYDPKRYWTDRHLRYGMTMQGVGNCTLSNENNEQMYKQARKVLEETCVRECVDWKTVRLLDIGCGNGFYTALFHECGVLDYTGVDISPVLLPELQKRFPSYRFVQLDISRQPLPDQYDLIVMIDVTQHIVHPRRFRRAMKNVRSCLKPGGLFLVTSWLSRQTIRRQPHEVARPLTAYHQAFPEAVFGDPVPFRDKFLLVIRNPLNPKGSK